MQTMNFINTPNTKPSRLPKPDLSASRFDWRPISSPIKAPRKGPRSSPVGKYDRPIIVPMKLPHLPYLVPPKYFTPSDGMM